MRVSGPGDGLFRHRGLIALAVGLSVLECGILVLVGPHASRGLAPQVTAPSPFGAFHDLRWLLVYHRSWSTLGFELAALLAFRGALDALLLRLARPPDAESVPFRTSFAHCVGFTAVALVALAPWTLLLFALAIIPISWLFFASIPPAIATVVLVHHGAARVGWWRALPPLRTSAWMLATFAVLTLGSLAISLSPVWPLALLSAAATGLFNAWAWTSIVRGLEHARPGERAGLGRVRRWVPVAPIALASIFAIVVGGSAIGFAAHQPAEPKTVAALAPSGHGAPVLVVSGFASHWDGSPVDFLGPGFREWRFSYRGLGPDGEPLAYGSKDTQQSLAALDRLMAQQVDAISRATGERVAIVAESEGSLVAKTYVLAYRDAPVRSLVMLSPLVRPGRVYYPAEDTDGWGTLTGWGLRGVSQLLSGLSPLELSPDSPFVRDVDQHGAALRDALACSAPGITQFAYVPLADAVSAPLEDEQDVEDPAGLGSVRVRVVPAFHGGLLGDKTVERMVRQDLEGNAPRTETSWTTAGAMIRGAAAAWQVPDLPVQLNPVWQSTEHPGLASPVRSARCDAVRSELRAMVGAP